MQVAESAGGAFGGGCAGRGGGVGHRSSPFAPAQAGVQRRNDGSRLSRGRAAHMDMRHRPYCWRRRDRLHVRPLVRKNIEGDGASSDATFLQVCDPWQDRRVVRRATRTNASGFICGVLLPAAGRASSPDLAARIVQPAPGSGPSLAAGGAPPPPGSVAANHTRGRRTGQAPELPDPAQDGRAAHLRRAPPFVPLSRRLMRAPL
jgi:hypothetical protein